MWIVGWQWIEFHGEVQKAYRKYGLRNEQRFHNRSLRGPSKKKPGVKWRLSNHTVLNEGNHGNIKMYTIIISFTGYLKDRLSFFFFFFSFFFLTWGVDICG